MGSSKGSEFERDICRRLSMWWTGGIFDDYFWRTSGSGARATVRGSKRTYGQCGDICAVHPGGEPLLKLFTFELKKGYNDISLGNMFEAIVHPKTKKPTGMWAFIEQAHKSAQMAGSHTWAIIHRRDNRQICLTFPRTGNYSPWLTPIYQEIPHIKAVIEVPKFLPLGTAGKITLIHVRLEEWLEIISPKILKPWIRSNL